MDIEARIELLNAKDTREAYENLLYLEKLSEKSDRLYKYLDKFFLLIDSKQYSVRVRGFRLLAKQAKWDRDNKIDQNIDKILNNIYDEKPTAIRMKLSAMKDILSAKKNLQGVVLDTIRNLDYSEFQESMRSLIAKDIQELTHA